MENLVKILDLLKRFCEAQVATLPNNEGCKNCPNVLYCDFDIWEAAQGELDEAEIKIDLFQEVTDADNN